jgi:hypothetical protein
MMMMFTQTTILNTESIIRTKKPAEKAGDQKIKKMHR